MLTFVFGEALGEYYAAVLNPASTQRSYLGSALVAAKDIRSAVFAMEELEAASRLTLETYGKNPIMLTKSQVASLNAFKN